MTKEELKKTRSLYSEFYEKLIEHVFISELLQEAWFTYRTMIEVLHSDTDIFGYDLVLECNGIVRHIQLKTTMIGGKNSIQKINKKLMEKPSGCIVWIFFEENNNRIKLDYLYFGGKAGEKLPDIESYKIAKHSKGNSKGEKTERPDIRKINKGEFKKLENIGQLFKTLFVA